MLFCPHRDGKYFLGHHSVEKTCAPIERYSPHDAKQYGEFIDSWQRVTNVITPVFNAPPKSLLDISGNFDFGKIKDLFSVIKSADKTLDFMRALFTRAKELLEGYFEEEFVRAPLARLAGEMSIPASQKTSAIGGMMTSLRHNPGVARPKGDTGALTQVLLKLVKSL